MRKRTYFILVSLVSAILTAVMLGDDKNVTVTVTVSPDPTTKAGSTRPSKNAPTSQARRRSRWQLSAEQQAQALEYLKEKEPARYEQVLELRKSNPKQYTARLRSTWWWMQRIKDMPLKVQQAYTLRRDAYVNIWRLVNKLRESDSADEKSRLSKQLLKQVRENFDAGQIVSEYQLGKLAERIVKMRQDLRKRAEDRDSLIMEEYQRRLAASTQPAAPTRRSWHGGRPVQPKTRPADKSTTRPAVKSTTKPAK